MAGFENVHGDIVKDTGKAAMIPLFPDASEGTDCGVRKVSVVSTKSEHHVKTGL